MSDNYANSYSIELELAVLATLWDGRTKEAPGIFLELLPRPEFFHNRNHQLIAQTIALMIGKGLRIDGLSIADALRQIRFLDAIPKGREGEFRFEDGVDIRDSIFAAIGPEYLGRIGEANPHSAGFRKNCELLADYHLQRQMIKTLAETLEKASAVDGRSKLMRVGDQVINDVSQIMGGAAVSATMDEAMAAVLRAHDAAQVKGKLQLATWGLASLDRTIPLTPGRMIVLSAAPGCGKTSLSLQTATATVTALGESTVAIINLEMPAEQLARILIGRTIKVSARNIENGWLTPAQRAAADTVRQAWEGTNLSVKGTAGKCTVDDTCAWIRQRYLRSRGRLRVVIVDYLQLIERANPRQTEYEVISQASKTLKRLALELNICVLVLSALARGGRASIRDGRTGALKANPEPRMEDLRGSGSIEGDADGIIFIWTEATEPSASMPVHLKVAKNRSGSEGTCEAMFDKANGQVFVDMIAPNQGATISADPADSSRKHHNHPPTPEEDKIAAAEASGASEHWGDSKAIGSIP